MAKQKTAQQRAMASVQGFPEASEKLNRPKNFMLGGAKPQTLGDNAEEKFRLWALKLDFGPSSSKTMWLESLEESQERCWSGQLAVRLRWMWRPLARPMGARQISWINGTRPSPLMSSSTLFFVPRRNPHHSTSEKGRGLEAWREAPEGASVPC